MTNATPPRPGLDLDAAIRSLAPVGGRPRPVKIVEHPAFRVARRRLAADAPFITASIPVVSLDPMPVFARYHADHLPATPRAA